MTKMLSSQQKVFPNVASLLSNELPQLPETAAKKDIWEAFVTFSELGEEGAKKALTFEQMPFVFIKPLNAGENGRFETAHPDRVLLADALARRFETAPSDDPLRTALEAKLLHELVHWGDHRDNVDQPGEEGENFEIAAYGGIVPVPGLPSATLPLRNLLSEPIRAEYTPMPNDPRGIRNNNPGNIRKGDPWEGLAEPQEMTSFQRDEGSFCVFKFPRWGIRAMSRLLMNYQDRFGLRTVEDMIGRWAPPDDNNATAAYVAHVSARMGLDPRTPFQFSNSRFAMPMVEAIIQHENGVQPYAASTTELGLMLAGIEPA